MISAYKDLKTKVVLWLSLVIGQNVSRQPVTNSENLFALNKQCQELDVGSV